MSRPDVPPSLIVYFVLIVSSIVLACVALGSHHWIDVTYGGSDISVGLFNKQCDIQDNQGIYTCAALNDKLIQGLMIPGLVCYVITVLFMGHLVLFKQMAPDSKSHRTGCITFSIIGGILTLIGVCKFVLDMEVLSFIIGSLLPKWEYGYCMYMAIASAVLCIAAGISGAMAVSKLFNIQHPQGIVVQQPMQPMAGIQMTNSSVAPMEWGQPNAGFTNPQDPHSKY